MNAKTPDENEFRGFGPASGPSTKGTALTFDGVKVFSATMAADRVQLGDRVTDWLAANPTKKLTEALVRQSSDSDFHCVSIIVFYKEEAAAIAARPARRLKFGA